MADDRSGSAFPYWQPFESGAESSDGLSRREWFATWAPEPTKEQIELQFSIDKLANPHNDSYKPRLRSALEIIASLRYAYADAMIAEGQKVNKP